MVVISFHLLLQSSEFYWLFGLVCYTGNSIVSGMNFWCPLRRINMGASFIIPLLGPWCFSGSEHSMSGWLVWIWRGSTSVLLCILVVLLVVILCSPDIKDPVSKDDKGLEGQETMNQTSKETNQTTVQTTTVQTTTGKQEPGCQGEITSYK